MFHIAIVLLTDLRFKGNFQTGCKHRCIFKVWFQLFKIQYKDQHKSPLCNDCKPCEIEVMAPMCPTINLRLHKLPDLRLQPPTVPTADRPRGDTPRSAPRSGAGPPLGATVGLQSAIGLAEKKKLSAPRSVGLPPAPVSPIPRPSLGFRTTLGDLSARHIIEPLKQMKYIICESICWVRLTREKRCAISLPTTRNNMKL